MEMPDARILSNRLPRVERKAARKNRSASPRRSCPTETIVTVLNDAKADAANGIPQPKVSTNYSFKQPVARAARGQTECSISLWSNNSGEVSAAQPPAEIIDFVPYGARIH